MMEVEMKLVEIKVKELIVALGESEGEGNRDSGGGADGRDGEV